MFARTHMQRFCASPMQAQTMLTSQFLIPTQHRNFGANEKALKIRMKSVNSIKKITKAMKMVAASKMAGDLRRLDAGKDYGTNAVDMIFKSDTYMQRRTGAEEKSDPKYLLCPITSDKGMCGGVNSNIFKQVRDFIADKKRENMQIFSIGSKGASAMRRPMPDILKTNVCEISTPYNYPTVMALSEHIIQAAEGSDKIVVFYNKFISAISSEIIQMQLLPRKRFLDQMKYGKLYNQTLPDKNTSNPALYELYITANLWTAMLNNASSETSARVQAMENASKNAGEILEALTLEYNKARQARITMELVEIISGANAL